MQCRPSHKLRSGTRREKPWAGRFFLGRATFMRCFLLTLRYNWWFHSPVWLCKVGLWRDACCHEAFLPASSSSALITLSIGALGARRGDRRPAVQRDIHLSWANALRCDQSPALSVSKPQVLPYASRMLLALVFSLLSCGWRSKEVNGAVFAVGPRGTACNTQQKVARRKLTN